MGPDQADAATRRNRKARTSAQGQPDDVEWNALDRPKRAPSGRELPEAYGPWQSVYARFAKWRDDGTLERVFHTLSGDEDMENLSMDSTCIKVHESANGGGKNGR